MNSIPEISLNWELENVHPLIKKVVLLKQSSKRSNSRKTKTFLKDLEKKLTRDQSNLDLVDGYVIPFQRKPFQSKIPFQLAKSRE